MAATVPFYSDAVNKLIQLFPSLFLYRRIEITPRDIYWNEGGELVCISTEESFFILKYNSEAAAKSLQTKENLTEDGVEDAFEVVAEIQEVVKTGAVGDVA